MQVLKRHADGRLDIMTQGRRRFKVLEVDQQESYLRARVEWLEPDLSAHQELSSEVRSLYALLLAFHGRAGIPPKSNDLEWSFALARSDVFDLTERQRLLEMASEAERLEFMRDSLQASALQLKPIGGNGRPH